MSAIITSARLTYLCFGLLLLQSYLDLPLSRYLKQCSGYLRVIFSLDFHFQPENWGENRQHTPPRSSAAFTSPTRAKTSK